MKEFTIEEAIEFIEECQCLEEPIVVRREDKKDVVFISIQEYNRLFPNNREDVMKALEEVQ